MISVEFDDIVPQLTSFNTYRVEVRKLLSRLTSCVPTSDDTSTLASERDRNVLHINGGCRPSGGKKSYVFVHLVWAVEAGTILSITNKARQAAV